MVMILGVTSLYLWLPTVLRELVSVKDARPTQTYSFLPASWAGNTHKETDFLPIGDREEREMTF